MRAQSMAPTRSVLRLSLRTPRSVPRRCSWIALLVAGMAAMSFVLFEAVDLDGLTLGLLASAPASTFGPNIRDSEADRWHAHTHASLLPIAVTPTAQRAITATGASTPRRRVQAVCPWHLPGPHAAPASADPL